MGTRGCSWGCGLIYINDIRRVNGIADRLTVLPYGVRCTLKDMRVRAPGANLKTTLENTAELTQKLTETLPKDIAEIKAMATVITVAIVTLSVVVIGAMIIGTTSKLAEASRRLAEE